MLLVNVKQINHIELIVEDLRQNMILIKINVRIALAKPPPKLMVYIVPINIILTTETMTSK
jgi:hypothetical protein